jgi:hypothetical protein
LFTSADAAKEKEKKQQKVLLPAGVSQSIAHTIFKKDRHVMYAAISFRNPHVSHVRPTHYSLHYNSIDVQTI